MKPKSFFKKKKIKEIVLKTEHEFKLDYLDNIA